MFRWLKFHLNLVASRLVRREMEVTMTTLTIELPESAFSALRRSPQEFAKEAQRRFVWVNSAHFRGKKAVRILSRIYSSSR